MIYEFDRISTEQFNEQDREQYTEFFETTLLKNDTFTVELEDKNFQLHIFITDDDMSEYENHTTDHVITLGVVPDFSSLSEKHQQDILSQFDGTDLYESVLSDKLYLTYEGLAYGFGIPLHSVTVSPEDIEHAVTSAIAVEIGVESLIGFDLDKRVNIIGNNGWDLLESYCNDVDIIQIALNRYNNNEE